MTEHGWTVAILGATGAVGQAMLRTLEQCEIPVAELRLLASPRGAGSTATFRDTGATVRAVSADSFRGVDLAFFAAGAAAAEEWAPVARRAGAWIVDNSSRFRMETEVALIVPEVNSHRLPEAPNLIANPNCSTIQMVVALKPLQDHFGLEEVFVSTYQSASGAGGKGLSSLDREWEGQPHPEGTYRFPQPLLGNVVPQCDVFLGDGYTREEEKMVLETQKILERPDLPVHPTCVRVPVRVAHSEAIYVRLGQTVEVDRVREILGSAAGLALLDDPEQGHYPTALMAAHTDEVWVGRIRRDRHDPHGLHLWVVADNLRKGAALNAVQIACLLWNRESRTVRRASV